MSSDWSAELRNAIRCPKELCRVLELAPEIAERAAAAIDEFPLVAPRSYVARMRPGDPHDPLLIQVLPQLSETKTEPGDRLDAVGDGAAMIAPGVLHKYVGRALLIASPVCAIHCRYCFRRHYPYESTPRGVEAWDEALRAIEQDETLTEVILSGGDPLALTDANLVALINRIRAIPHVSRLRIHTRLPIVIPSRITETLLEAITGKGLSTVFVVHVNHANELSAEVEQALAKVADRGALLFNQAVLLRGVNDSALVLEELSRRLIDLRVTPYYLHRLDRVRGAAHFATAEGVGEALIAQLRERLPGYAVPRYVAEEPGKPHKTLLA